MSRSPTARYTGILCASALAVVLATPVLARGTRAPAGTVQSAVGTLGDLSRFRLIAEDTLRIVSAGDFGAARTRIKDLETAWDKAEEKLRPRNREQWRRIDKAIDAALAQLRAEKPDAAASRATLTELLPLLETVGQASASGSDAEGTPTAASTRIADFPKISVQQAIGTAEGRDPGSAVLDVSFEPEGGRPMYQVRTYKNGRVWDGAIDGTDGKVVGDGTTTAESALDDEDKAELAGLRIAKTTLREVVAVAERQAGGTVVSAGLEQVGGHIVWEIVVQRGTKSSKVLVDPTSGQIARHGA